MEDAIALLGDLTGPTHQDLGVPKLAISELEAAVAQSGQEKLSQAYKVGHYWGGGGGGGARVVVEGACDDLFSLLLPVSQDTLERLRAAGKLITDTS